RANRTAGGWRAARPRCDRRRRESAQPDDPWPRAAPRSRSSPSRLRSRAARSSSPPSARRGNILASPPPQGPGPPPSWAPRRAPPPPLVRRKRASTRPRAAGGSRGFGRCRSLGGFLGLRFALLARNRADRIVAFLAFHHARLVEKAQHPVGGQRALGKPCLDLVEIELEALGLIFRQQRIEITQPLDEAAVARRTAVRNHDVIDRPLLGSGAGEADFQGHLRVPFWSMHLIVGGCVKYSLLLSRSRQPAQARGLATKPRQQRAAGKLRRQTGHGGRKAGSARRAARQSG